MDYEKVWTVVPFYATGSSWDGTRQYNWTAKRIPAAHNRSGVSYPDSDEGQRRAENVAEIMTEKNEEF